MQNAFCGNPFGILLDAPGMSAYHGTWAALALPGVMSRALVIGLGNVLMGGFRFHEAPRGTLSHWVVIKGGKIEMTRLVHRLSKRCCRPSTAHPGSPSWTAGLRG